MRRVEGARNSRIPGRRPELIAAASDDLGNREFARINRFTGLDYLVKGARRWENTAFATETAVAAHRGILILNSE
jgi:hypothetical protein